MKSTQFNFLYISWLKCFCIINQSFSEPELADKALCTNRSKFKYSFFQFQQPQIMLRSTWMLRQTPLWHLIATLPALERTPLLVSMIVFLRPIWGLSSYFWFLLCFLITHITSTGNAHHHNRQQTSLKKKMWERAYDRWIISWKCWLTSAGTVGHLIRQWCFTFCKIVLFRLDFNSYLCVFSVITHTHAYPHSRTSHITSTHSPPLHQGHKTLHRWDYCFPFLCNDTTITIRCYMPKEAL